VQAAVTERQIVIAAEVNTDPQDFGHLGPMMSAVQRERERVGVSERIGAVVADVGYWHFQQMDELAAQGIPVLIPPDSKKRKTTRPGWDGGRYAWMRRLLASDHGREIYAKRHKLVEPVFWQIKFNRKIDRFQRRGRGAALSECLSYVKEFVLIAALLCEASRRDGALDGGVDVVSLTGVLRDGGVVGLVSCLGWQREEAVKAPGEVPFEAAESSLLGLSFGEFAFEERLSVWVDTGAGDRDDVQRPVELAVPAAVQSVLPVLSG
jgi:hypothetical protein